MKYVALLRGINVGGRRSIRMADLRTMFTDAGATDVAVRTARELAAVVAKNPYAQDADNVHVMFLAAKTTASLTGAPNESHVFVGRELYLHLPDGMGRSKLGASAGKLGGTVRNWRTVTALLAMSQA